MGGRIGLCGSCSIHMRSSGGSQTAGVSRKRLATPSRKTRTTSSSAPRRRGKSPRSIASAGCARPMRWPTISAAASPTRASRSWPSASPMPNAPDDCPALIATPSTACSSPRPWRTIWLSSPTRRRSTGTASTGRDVRRQDARARSGCRGRQTAGGIIAGRLRDPPGTGAARRPRRDGLSRRGGLLARGHAQRRAAAADSAHQRQAARAAADAAARHRTLRWREA